MPLLFSLGQHGALVAVQAQLKEGEMLFIFLDDIYIICSPARVGEVYESWRRHCVRRLASTSTRARRSYGTRQASSHLDRCFDVVRSPGGGSTRSCVERRLGFAAEPAGPQGSWSAHRPPIVHHSSHGSEVQGTGVAL